MAILLCSVLAKSAPSRARCVLFAFIFSCRPHARGLSKRETKKKSALIVLLHVQNMLLRVSDEYQVCLKNLIREAFFLWFPSTHSDRSVPAGGR